LKSHEKTYSDAFKVKARTYQKKYEAFSKNRKNSSLLCFVQIEPSKNGLAQNFIKNRSVSKHLSYFYG
jgi:hypothetical protein